MYEPGHISGAGNDLVVIKEAATWEVSVVPRQLPADTDIAFARLEAVDRTDVVETAARDKISRGGVGTCHNPAWAQRYRMYLWMTQTRHSRTTWNYSH